MEFDSGVLKMVLALSLINLLAAISGILIAATGRILEGVLVAIVILILFPGVFQYFFLRKSSKSEE